MSTISTERLREILAGTEGVTPGPWIRSGVRQRLPAEADCLWIGPDSWLIAGVPIGTGHNTSSAFRDAGFMAMCDPDTVKAIVIELLSLRSQPEDGWRCFHCDEVFTDKAAALLHFGKSEVQDPICTVTAERYREVERQLESYRTETDAASKAFYSLGADHYRRERDAEQKGYDRGLADAKAYPETLGLARLPTSPGAPE